MSAPDLELVYIGDPMCSWCWGFNPVLEALDARYDFPLRVVVGGLRPGPNAEAMDDKMAAFIAHHWHQVEAASGQPFDHAILQRRGWRYDTELPCVAVVAMRELAPERTLAFFARLHRAFYAEGVDITAADAYPALAGGFAPDVDAFMAALRSPGVKQRAWRDFAWARQMGVSGFPTLLLRSGEQWIPVTYGYRDLAGIQAPLDRWLGKTFSEEQVQGLYCAIDGSGC